MDAAVHILKEVLMGQIKIATQLDQIGHQRGGLIF
jgi:hypothetical protein